jgi:hypothetical protein
VRAAHNSVAASAHSASPSAQFGALKSGQVAAIQTDDVQAIGQVVGFVLDLGAKGLGSRQGENESESEKGVLHDRFW